MSNPRSAWPSLLVGMIAIGTMARGGAAQDVALTADFSAPSVPATGPIAPEPTLAPPLGAPLLDLSPGVMAVSPGVMAVSPGVMAASPGVMAASPGVMAGETANALTAPAAEMDPPPFYPTSPPQQQQQLFRTELEYLLWWSGDTRRPELLRGNAASDSLADVGNPDLSTTHSLIDSQSAGGWPQSGLRLRLSRDRPDYNVSRLEFTGWVFFKREDSQNVRTSNQYPTLSRPFTNAVTGLPDSQVISFPGIATGEMDVSYSRRFFGFDPILAVCTSGDHCDVTEALFGYRFWRYEDQLRVQERIVMAGTGAVGEGTAVSIVDDYRARNDYHLFPLGINFLSRTDRWQLQARGLVSLGFTHQELEIRGRTTTTVGQLVAHTSGNGFTAQPNLVGQHERTEFAWVPELSFTLRRCLAKNVWLNAGYTVLYLNQVIHAPEHYSQSVDPNLLAPVTSGVPPASLAFHSSDEWLHGFNFGITWEF